MCLSIVGCSLQNFDSLSSGADTAGRSGAGGSPGGGDGGASGAGPSGGSDAGGSGGQGPRAGSGGASGSSSSPGGAAGSSAGSGGSASSGGSGGSPPPGDGGVALNLLPDPSFESGHVGWVQFGVAALANLPGEGRDGSQCLAATSRGEAYAGPSIDLRTLVDGGVAYTAEAWVRTSDTATQPVSLSIKTACTGEAELYAQLVTELVAAGEWLFLSGSFTAATCTLAEYTLYIEGPAAGVDLYVDDVGLYQAP